MMRRGWGPRRVAVAAALVGAFGVLPALAQEAADCAQKRKGLSRARQQADRLRAKLRRLILAGQEAEKAKVDEIQAQLIQREAELDRLAEAVKDCPAAPRVKKPRKKAPRVKERPAKAAVPQPPRPEPTVPIPPASSPRPWPPAAPPGAPGAARVVLAADRIRSGTLLPVSCAEQALQAPAPSFEHEGRPAVVPGVFAAWQERQRRHEEVRRVGKRTRELLEQCQQEVGGDP
jgi:hypothetical protein